MKADYYKTLGVDKNASEAEIKKSYRRLAMKHHPDRNPDDKAAEAKFKEAKEAYEILTDSQKRSAYDQFGHAGVDPSQGGGGFDGAGGFGGAEGLGDIFGSMFGDIFGGQGGQGRQTRVHRGDDLRYEVEIELEQAAHGDQITINVPSMNACDGCDGSGAKAGTQASTCETCAGQGQVRMQQGFFSVQQACPNCRGRGKVIKDPCGTCHGNGRVQKTKNLKVDIPAGIDTGNRIRLSGEGEAGLHGGPAGDLFVDIHILPHAFFERDGGDLHCVLPISFATAALGGTVEVPTLGGKVSVKIPAGTQTSKVFRVRGKGMRTIRSTMPGDMHCHAKIETPVSLSKEQKELIEKLDRSLSKDASKHNPEVSSWLGGVKGLFERLRKAS